MIANSEINLKEKKELSFILRLILTGPSLVAITAGGMVGKLHMARAVASIWIPLAAQQNEE